MEDIFWPSVSFVEKALRPAIIYIFLVMAFRLMGKREVGQFTPFDLIVLLTISNILQNAMIGNDTSVLGGIVGASTILLMNRVLNWLAVYHPRWLGKLVDQPAVLIKDGQVQVECLHRELVTFDELYAALRKHGIEDVAEVKLAMLELDGQISVITRERS